MDHVQAAVSSARERRRVLEAERNGIEQHVAQDAAAALAAFHEERTASNAQALASNKAAEAAAAEALANETNPWNTVAGLVDVHAAAAQTSNLSSYNKCLLELKAAPVVRCC